MTIMFRIVAFGQGPCPNQPFILELKNRELVNTEVGVVQISKAERPCEKQNPCYLLTLPDDLLEKILNYALEKALELSLGSIQFQNVLKVFLVQDNNSQALAQQFPEIILRKVTQPNLRCYREKFEVINPPFHLIPNSSIIINRTTLFGQLYASVKAYEKELRKYMFLITHPKPEFISFEDIKKELTHHGSPTINAFIFLLSINRYSEQAMAELRNSAVGNVEIKAAIVDAGGIPPLVALLSTRNKTTAPQRELAAAILRLLAAGNDKIKAAMVNAGCIEALTALLNDRDATADQKLQVALVLDILAAGNDKIKAAIVAAHGIALLVAFLSDRNATADQRELVLVVLGTLADGNDKIKAAIVDAGGIALLVAFLNDKNATADQRFHSATMLSLLTAGNDEIKAKIVAKGGIEALHTLLREQRELATTLLRNLSGNI